MLPIDHHCIEIQANPIFDELSSNPLSSLLPPVFIFRWYKFLLTRSPHLSRKIKKHYKTLCLIHIIQQIMALRFIMISIDSNIHHKKNKFSIGKNTHSFVKHLPYFVSLTTFCIVKIKQINYFHSTKQWLVQGLHPLQLLQK